MKTLRFLALPAIAAVASIVIAFSSGPQSAQAQVNPAHAVSAALTTACSSDPCASTSVAVITVPAGSSTCGGDVYGTFNATGVYEVTNVSPSAVLADWSPVSVAPTTWAGNTGFSTATNRAFAVHFATPLKNTSYFRVRLSARTAGTVNVYLTCAGDASVIQPVPGYTPGASPTP